MASKKAGPRARTVVLTLYRSAQEALEACERGEIALGGCCRDPDEEEWRFRSCGYGDHTLWHSSSEVRQLVYIYYSTRSGLLKSEKTLQKCTARLAHGILTTRRFVRLCTSTPPHLKLGAMLSSF